MNVIDAIILVPLLYFGFQGFRNGLLREVLGLGGVLLALFLGFRHMDAVGKILDGLFDLDPVWVSVLSFVVLFVGIIAAVQILIISLEKVLKMALLSMPNRIFGLLFGLLKSSLFLSAFFILLLGFGVPDKETRHDSMLYPYVMAVAPAAYNLVGIIYPGTDSFTETIQKALEEYEIDF